jgi:hypothetical protein
VLERPLEDEEAQPDCGERDPDRLAEANDGAGDDEPRRGPPARN